MTTNLLYDEKAVLQQIGNGDELAFARLFQNWYPVLDSFIFRITKSRELAAEVVQDVFMKIWINKEVLPDIDNFGGYLFTISRNHAINALKKSMLDIRRRYEHLRQSAISDNELQPGIIKESGIPELLDEAIDRLSPRQKQVYLLHRHQRLTYRQIADQLGIGSESVKTHLELAVKAITKYLRGRYSSVSILIFFLN